MLTLFIIILAILFISLVIFSANGASFQEVFITIGSLIGIFLTAIFGAIVIILLVLIRLAIPICILALAFFLIKITFF
jgi:hypothetical protein